MIKPQREAVLTQVVDYKRLKYSNKEVTEAEKWLNDTGKFIVYPVDSLEVLENLWIYYNSMPLKHRRESDWKCIELFGISNQQMYDWLKHNFLGDDINDLELPEDYTPDVISEEAIDSNDQVDYSRLSYTLADVEDAILWTKNNNMAMIYPTKSLEDLEKLWDEYNAMLLKHRRVSDWESEKIFGITNLKHYIYLKNKFLQSDIEKPSMEEVDSCTSNEFVEDHFRFLESYAVNNLIGKESNNKIAKVLFESYFHDNRWYYQNNLENTISNILAKEELVSRVDMDFLPSSDLPYYTPEEMIDMGVFCHAPADNYFGVEADNMELADDIATRTWFEEYRYHFNGIDTPNREKMYKARVKKLTELTMQLRLLEARKASEKAILAKKQSILELGWNPEIEFNPKNRVAVNELYKHRNNSKISTQFVNMNGVEVLDEADVTVMDKPTLKPVYIILTEGKSLFSAAIKKVTDSAYSHASISFDLDLHDMYSYDIDIPKQSGFRKWDIEEIDKDKKIAIFAIFLKEEDYNKLKENIEWFKDHAKETAYSFRNIFSFIFNIEPDKNDMRMFCSQFVDRLLKLIGVDITGLKSNKVSPAEFKKISTTNNKIYTFYEGLKDKYNPNKLKRLVNRLVRNQKVITIKEANYKNLILRINNLDTMRQFKSDYLNESGKEVFDKLIAPCLEASEYKFVESSVIDPNTFSYLDIYIRSFGKMM